MIGKTTFWEERRDKSLHEGAEFDGFPPDFMGCALGFVCRDRLNGVAAAFARANARLINKKIRDHACKMPVNRVGGLSARSVRRKSLLHTQENVWKHCGGRGRERNRPQSVNQPRNTSAKSIPEKKSSNKTDFYCGLNAPPTVTT